MEADTSLNTSQDLLCTPNNCIAAKDDEYTLACNSCKRSVHFECTQLPIYQLQLILNTKSKRYTCVNCVEISKSLMEIMPRAEKGKTAWLKKEITGCENVIKAQKSTIENQKEELKILRQRLTKQQNIESMEKRICEKIDSLKEDVGKKLDPIYEKQLSFADAVRSNNNNTKPIELKNIITEARQEELREQRDKKSRENNIIIHGITDPQIEDPQLMENWDKAFTSRLLSNINVYAITKEHIRIGKITSLRRRPLKVSFHDKSDKEKVMKNLKNLKDLHVYKGMSITEDLTSSERSLYKQWTIKAKEKNEQEGYDSNYVWRVRGSPKTGFFLKRLIGHNQSSQ